MKAAILQSNYIPWKGYFDIINKSDFFIFLDTVQYTKNDWRNRNQIPTKNGLTWLTIPVIHKQRSKQTIATAEIKSISNWQRKHRQTLSINYSKSDYFNEVMNILHETFSKDWIFLSELNQFTIKQICNYLQINTKIVNVEELNIPEIQDITDKNERLLKILKVVEASTYISGPSAKSYLDIEKYTKNSVDIYYMDYSNYPEYNQNLDNFSHHVSILDLLFKFGPNTGKYIWGAG